MATLGAVALLLSCRQPAVGGESEAGSADPVAAVSAVSAWGEVLEKYHRGGGLDYRGLQADRSALDSYLGSLAAARPADGSRHEQMAFWVNAYNAVVAEFVLRRYPGIVSVRDVDGFFDDQSFPVAGEQLTLDQIEARARALSDPRVHFAVVCASTSCPDLRPEPYEAGALEEQLAEQTALFLAQPDKGLRYDETDNVLWLSSIFKWYAGDFTGGSTVIAFVMRGKVREWVAAHVPPELGRTLVERDPEVRYLDYDWSLNDRPAGESTVAVRVLP